MPTTMTEHAQATQEQTLESIRETQDRIVEAVKTWAKAVEKNTPDLDLPAVPFADQLPTPLEVVRTSSDFAERLLKAQREFTESVLAAAAPALATKTAGKATKSE